METEPHFNPNLPIGSLDCETGHQIEVTPSDARIHFFGDGSYPCIEVLNRKERQEEIYRITTHGILDAMTEYGVPLVIHVNDLAFRNSDIIAINAKGNGFGEWDFLPKDSEQTVGQEVAALLRPDFETVYLSPEDKEWLDQEIEEPVFDGLPPFSTLLVEIEDHPDLSYIALTDGEEVQEYQPIPRKIAERMKENGFFSKIVNLQDINDRMWGIIAEAHIKNIDLFRNGEDPLL